MKPLSLPFAPTYAEVRPDDARLKRAGALRRWFLNVSTRNKLLLGFGAMFGLFVVATLAGYLALRAMQEAQRRLFEDDFATSQDAYALRSHLDASRSALLTMMMQRGLAGQRVWQRETLQRADDANKVMSRLRDNAPPDTPLFARTRDLAQTLQRYEQTRDALIVPRIYAGDADGARRLFLGVQTEYYQQLRAQAEAISQLTQTKARGALAQSQAGAERAGQLFALLGVLTLASGGAMALLLSHAIAVPMGRISGLAQRIADGDLSVEVPHEERRDEVGALSESFGRMTASLQELARVADRIAQGHMDDHITPRSETDLLAKAFDALDRQATELRRRNEHIETDLHMAREMQAALLPQSTLDFAPSQQADALHFGARFCSRYRPTTQLAGDFFDVFAIDDAHIGLFVCDVMGHGVRAALVTAMLSALMEESRGVAHDPSRFLGRINGALTLGFQRARLPVFATAFYGVADLARGEFCYANAGHPGPLHVHRGAETVAVEQFGQESEHSGPALGVFENADFPSHCRPLRAGDLLVLFTDGLSEAQNPGGEEFGEERLQDAIRTRLEMDAAPLFDAMIQEVETFCDHRAFEDDVCLVGLELPRRN